MSVHVFSAVFKREFGQPQWKSVALKLADCAGDDGSRIFPSLDRIAAETEWSKKTVQRAIEHFLDIGLLHRVRGGGYGPGDTTEYRMDLVRLEEFPLAFKNGKATRRKMVPETILARRPTRWPGTRDDGPPVLLDGPPVRLDGLAVTTDPSVNRQRTVIDSEREKKLASPGTDKGVPRFSESVLAKIAKMNVALEPLIDRYLVIARSKPIERPSAYLLAMAHDDVAMRSGATPEQVKKSMSRDRAERIEAASDVAGEFCRPSPEAIELARRRRRQHIDEAISAIAARTFRTQADCDREFDLTLANYRFRPPSIEKPRV